MHLAAFPQQDSNPPWTPQSKLPGSACHRQMRIVTCDDHPVVLMGLRAVLRDQGNQFDIVAEATSGKGVLDMLPKVSCDLLITDFSMGGGDDTEDGLPLLSRLHAVYPKLPVIVLTMLHNPALVEGMLATGVRAVIDKKAMMKELIIGIHAVSCGRIYLSEHVKSQLAELAVGNKRKRSLSAREAEVVRLFAQGLSVTEIAQRTGRSVRTISQQKREAMRKLGIDCDKQLHEYARQAGLA